MWDSKKITFNKSMKLNPNMAFPIMIKNVPGLVQYVQYAHSFIFLNVKEKKIKNGLLQPQAKTHPFVH
jgi:hypothetical protein